MILNTLTDTIGRVSDNCEENTDRRIWTGDVILVKDKRYLKLFKYNIPNSSYTLLELEQEYVY